MLERDDGQVIAFEIKVDALKRAHRRPGRQHARGPAREFGGWRGWIDYRAEQRRTDLPQVVCVAGEEHEGTINPKCGWL